MTKDKKPWRKVGKLDVRIKNLEDVVARQYRHYCIDQEKITIAFSGEIKQVRQEIDLVNEARNIVLRNIRKTIDNLIDPEN